tara:strand:+ start:555 stop:1685 length:1131 start_codon:yes stop_codon:yes gene_type:complete
MTTQAKNLTSFSEGIADNGNVGIGTTSPDANLVIEYAGDDPTGATSRVGAFSIKGGHTTLDMGVNDDSPYNSWIQTRHKSTTTYPTAYYNLGINPLGGNVGIGTTSPAYKLDVASTIQIRAGESLRLQNVAGSSAATIQCAGAGTNSDLGFSTAGSERMRIDSSGDVLVKTQDARIGSDVGAVEYGTTTANSVRFYSGTERLRIDDSGNLNIAKISSNIATAGHTFGTSGYQHSTRNGNLIHLNQLDADGYAIVIMQAGATKGSVFVNSTGTTYNTTSDRRLKDNIKPISDATDKLMDMKPVTHTWIDNPDEPQVHGFIAQEMQEVVPEAVSGDAESDEMMSMDYGRITPVIVAALQDALNEIRELKTRIDELENN